MSKHAFAGPYRDTVTRYNRRSTAMLDAPRTYNPRITETPAWLDKTIIAASVAVLIAVGVMILQAL